MSLTQRRSDLSIPLPPVSGPFGAYVPVKRSGHLLYVAGTLPMRDGKLMATGPVPTQQPAVANGASELLLELFNDAGRHVRAAVGMNVLPLDASVEVEFVFELRG